MELIEKNKYTFPVKEIKNESGNLYYIIQVNGYDCQVRAFEFQRQERPKKIICIYKGRAGNGEPIFSQDLAPLINKIFKVGQSYEFRIRQDLRELGGYYEAVDYNGFIARIVSWGNNQLYINQVVKCKILSINLIRIELEVEDLKQNEGIPFYTPQQIIDLDDTNIIKHWRPLRMFEKLSVFREAREQYADGNALWVLTAISAIDNRLPEWLNSGLKHKKRTLQLYHNVCLKLVEESDYLINCTEQERIEYQSLIAKATTHAADYLNAFSIMSKDGEQEYIKATLEKLHKTGYLLNPSGTMRTIMSIFALRQKSVGGYIQDIFNLILEHYADEHFMELYKHAFIQMLDVYIQNVGKSMDLLSSAFDNKSRHQVEEMVRALSMQLLLTDKETYKGWNMCRSLLYRSASLLSSLSADNLLDKAYQSLLFHQNAPLEFSWEDIKDIKVLTTKLSSGVVHISSNETKVFQGHLAQMRIAGNDITFTPIQRDGSERRCYFDGMLPWHNIEVKIKGKLDEKVSAMTTDINQFQRMWNELDKSLFAMHQPVVDKTKWRNQTPEINEVVYVRVTGQDPLDKTRFYCRIEQEPYTGEGVLNIHSIVRYNVDANMNSFIDHKGNPYLLKARVATISDNGKIGFDLSNEVAEYIKDNFSIGTSILAKISFVGPTFYLCISDFGFALVFNKESSQPYLHLGDYVWVNITEVHKNGNVVTVFDEKADDSERPFTTLNVFNSLIAEYAGGKTYVEDIKDEEESPESIIPSRNVRELVHIIDRHAMLEKNQISSFNYLAIARILSKMLEDKSLEDYYAKRMELVKAMKLFETNGSIDDEKLNTLLEDNESLVSTYPDVKSRLTQLKIINMLGKSWNEDFLWNTANDHDNETTSQLAQLVLSYNMLSGMNLYEYKTVLRKKIYQLMNLQMTLPKEEHFAEEDQFTELKSSLFYPADNNMIANENSQIEVIMKVICSFLNAKGGTLLLGISNQGTVIGVENDFNYLNGHRGDYDLQDMKDKYDRKLRDAVHNTLGVIANNLLTTSWLYVDNKWIYKVNVEPSADIIKYEGTAYVRQGTSKWPVPASQLTMFRKQRERLFK